MLLYHVQKFAPLLSRKWCKLLHAIQKYTKFSKFEVLYFPHFSLQHFATKLCNFTNFRMLFLAVVMDFVLLTQIKISSIAGIIHCKRCSTVIFKVLFNETVTRITNFSFHKHFKIHTNKLLFHSFQYVASVGDHRQCR